MIKKFLAIKNVGRFKDCAAVGEVDFRKITLVYAENGRGKTTLCDILRSLQTGSPHLIIGRKTLGADGSPHVSILFDPTEQKIFNAGGWSSAFPSIAIYDSNFVHENVFAGDVVDHEHKRNLYRVIIGEEGVRLAKEVDDLDAKSRDASRDLSALKTSIELIASPIYTVDAFLKLTKDADIDTKFAKAREQLRALNRASEIKNKESLKKIVLPSVPSDFKPSLANVLADVEKDSEARLAEHIANHTDEASEEWISEGLSYAKDDLCPFCSQSLKGNVLVKAYQTYFSEAYSNLKERLQTQEQNISSALGETALLSLQAVVSNNSTLTEFWKQFTTLVEASIDFDNDIRSTLDTLRERALHYLEKKISAPLEKVIPGKDFDEAVTSYDALLEKVKVYNQTIETINTAISTVKQKTAAGDVEQTRKTLNSLEIAKKRFEDKTVAVCQSYQDSLAAKADIEKKKTAAKEALDAYGATVFNRHETAVNGYLKRFGAGFRISDTKRSYVGGKASSTYQIVINKQAVDLGDSTTPANVPCFKNTLSAGDKSTLSLAFFLSQLDHDANLSNKIVILDDPFTSQDRSRRRCTQQIICDLAKRAKQVVVLSHDPKFLHSISSELSAAEYRSLQFFRRGPEDSTISEWDITTEMQNDYFQNHRKLTKYFEGGSNANLRDIVRCIRPLLEHYLRFKLPWQFNDGHWLGDMVGAIRDCDSSSPLHNARAILTELDQINDYSKIFHHDQNSSGADTEPIDDGELRSYVDRTLSIVGGF